VIRIKPAIVAGDEHIILCHRDVEFECRHADLQCRIETRHGVLGCKAARATTAL
jgi:hypothetical protein